MSVGEHFLGGKRGERARVPSAPASGGWQEEEPREDGWEAALPGEGSGSGQAGTPPRLPRSTEQTQRLGSRGRARDGGGGDGRGAHTSVWKSPSAASRPPQGLSQSARHSSSRSLWALGSEPSVIALNVLHGLGGAAGAFGRCSSGLVTSCGVRGSCGERCPALSHCPRGTATSSPAQDGMG